MNDFEKLPFEESTEIEKELGTLPKTKQELKQGVKVLEKKAIAISRTGLMEPSDSSELYRVAELLLSSRALPKVYENVAQVVMAMQVLRGLNFPEAVALRQTTIINGSVSIWGELPLALLQRSGQLTSMDEFFFMKDYTKISFENKNLNSEVYGAYCSIQRGNSNPVIRTFTVEDAKSAGLLNKTGPWQNYRKRMLQMKARGWAMKDLFPDVLYGVGLAEYDHDLMPDGGAIGKEDVSKELNEAFLEPAEGKE